MAKAIDIRDRRIGRLTLSSRTDDPLEYEVRKRAIYALLDEGERGLAVIAGLRAKRLHIEDVAEKVRQRRVADLLDKATEVDAPDPQMLGATIDRFLTRVEAKQSAGTLTQYASLCRNMERTLGVRRDPTGRVAADVPIARIGAEEAEGWLHGEKDTTGRPWSARRQNLAHAVALQVWALAIEADEERAEMEGAPRTVTRNLFAKGKARIRPPKIRKTRVVFLSREKAGRLLWAVRGRPEGLLMALGIYAGLRAGEAVNLRAEDVRRGELHIQPREGRHPWRPKTDNSVREVPISRALARWLRAHIRDGYAGEKYLTHPAGRDRPISPKTRERWTIAAFERAGITYGRDRGDGATFHTLRHTFASYLAQQDVQLMKIAALMGDTVHEVQQTYAHLTPKDLTTAINRLSNRPDRKTSTAGDLSGAKTATERKPA